MTVNGEKVWIRKETIIANLKLQRFKMATINFKPLINGVISS